MTSRYQLWTLFITIVTLASAPARAGTPDACPREAKDFIAIQQKAAEKDPVAQTALAFCYDLGQHVQPDGKEAIRLLTEAAGQGYAPAQYEVGRIYLYGRGVPIDYAKALLWERRAAEQGDPRAQRDLAFMYERGFGVPADPSQAAGWNRKAATQGQPEAQLHLAEALDQGNGVSKDPAQAREWYSKAARQEQPAAQLELARKLAQNGNCVHAVYFYQEAAAHGRLEAMYELGRLFSGSRCGANRNEAFMWFTIGARFASRESKAEADKLEPEIAPAQRKRAQRAAAKWIKEHPGTEKDEDEEEKR
jgi:uncharacterized protein